MSYSAPDQSAEPRKVLNLGGMRGCHWARKVIAGFENGQRATGFWRYEVVLGKKRIARNRIHLWGAYWLGRVEVVCGTSR